jgi:hypothetical protein
MTPAVEDCRRGMDGQPTVPNASPTALPNADPNRFGVETSTGKP